MSLTRMGEEALAAATQTLEEWTYENEHIEEIRQQRREAASAAARAEVRVNIEIAGETEKAWRVWDGHYTRLYGRMVKSYQYLPKSQVSLDGVELVMPRWLANQYGW